MCEKREEDLIQLKFCVVVVVGCAVCVCVCVHVLRLLATPYCAAFVYMETAMSESENSKLPEVSGVVWTDNRHQPQLTCVLFVSSATAGLQAEVYNVKGSWKVGTPCDNTLQFCIMGNVNGYTCISLYVMCFVCLFVAQRRLWGSEACFREGNLLQVCSESDQQEDLFCWSM